MKTVPTVRLADTADAAALARSAGGDPAGDDRYRRRGPGGAAGDERGRRDGGDAGDV